MPSILHGRQLGHQPRLQRLLLLLVLLLQCNGIVHLVNAGEGCVNKQRPGLLRQLLPLVQQRQMVPRAGRKRCAGDADRVLQGLQLQVLLPLVVPRCRMRKGVSGGPGRGQGGLLRCKQVP